MSKVYDIIVIGGGPAGYVAAIKAAQLKGKVALVEKSVHGGTCLNRGCIPTKNYLKTAEMIREIEEASSRGVMLESTALKVDMSKVVKGKNKVVKKLTGGVSLLLKANGVDTFDGLGSAVTPKSVKVAGKDGDTILETKTIILAGGSESLHIPIPGVDSPLVLSSTEMLDLTEVPAELAVIGGGVIGIEMGQIFSAFGSKVTVIEAAERILPFMEEEASKLIAAKLKKQKVDVKAGVMVQEIVEKSGKLTLKLSDGSTVGADKALLSIGRGPDLSCLGDLKPAMEKGKIKVNDKMETSIPGIYAPGDINGQKMLAHAAFKMGEVAAENALGGNVKADLSYVPAVVYCQPEVGSVGLLEEEAKKQNDISVGYFPLAANGRALASGAPEGYVKVIADKKYGEILGVHMVGLGASEIINEAAALMAMEITIHELAEIIHGHPSVSEALMEAAADAVGHCIHLPPK